MLIAVPLSMHLVKKQLRFQIHKGAQERLIHSQPGCVRLSGDYEEEPKENLPALEQAKVITDSLDWQ
jgi:hypothetical protein